jgi:5-methylcytosine-specific restriction endonuclease McrA
MSNFYGTAPTPQAAWRTIVLLGDNTRTYKFALGHALLESAISGKTYVTLEELARIYSLEMAKHSEYPQGPSVDPSSTTDMLSILARERATTLQIGQPTELLVQAAIKSMPGMVMQKFHNIPDGFVRDFDFYSLEKVNGLQVVQFSDQLMQVASSPDLTVLKDELSSRWNIVEASFSPEIGGTLRIQGVVASADREFLELRRNVAGVNVLRRPQIARLRPALTGFQSGLCFHCEQPLSDMPETPHVDHVIARAYVARKFLTSDFWRGVDIDGVWNLVVSHADCNISKRDKPPTAKMLQDLRTRNDLAIRSNVPVSQTIRLVTKSPSDRFYGQLRDALREGGVSV